MSVKALSRLSMDTVALRLKWGKLLPTVSMGNSFGVEQVESAWTGGPAPRFTYKDRASLSIIQIDCCDLIDSPYILISRTRLLLKVRPWMAVVIFIPPWAAKFSN